MVSPAFVVLGAGAAIWGDRKKVTDKGSPRQIYHGRILV